MGHSSPHALEISAQSLQTCAVNSLLRAMKPAASRQNAAQSMSSAMHRAIVCALVSFSHETAQWSQASAHALQASMQAGFISLCPMKSPKKLGLTAAVTKGAYVQPAAKQRALRSRVHLHKGLAFPFQPVRKTWAFF